MMTFRSACNLCISEHGILTLSEGEIRDDGRYEFTCKNGHKAVSILQSLKFELLFEIGAHAILDGYYREAVSSFTSSLERLYEFFLRSCLYNSQLNSSFDKSWKKVAGQSERQLGAFIFLYTMQFGHSPETLSDKHVQFRNSVIHKGKIPTKEEAIEYGEVILHHIRSIACAIREKYSHGANLVINEYVENCKREDDIAPSCTIVALIAGLGSVWNKENRESFRQALSNLEFTKKSFGSHY